MISDIFEGVLAKSGDQATGTWEATWEATRCAGGEWEAVPSLEPPTVSTAKTEAGADEDAPEQTHRDAQADAR